MKRLIILGILSSGSIFSAQTATLGDFEAGFDIPSQDTLQHIKELDDLNQQERDKLLALKNSNNQSILKKSVIVYGQSITLQEILDELLNTSITELKNKAQEWKKELPGQFQEWAERAQITKKIYAIRFYQTIFNVADTVRDALKKADEYLKKLQDEAAAEADPIQTSLQRIIE